MTTLADVAAEWTTKGPETRPILLEQFGSTDDATALGSAVECHAAIPFSEAVQRMLEPAVLVVVQPSNFRHQIPTKLYDYLRTGNPILILAPRESATWELASSFARCIRADPDDHDSVREALGSLLQDWRTGRLVRVVAHDTDRISKRATRRQFAELIRRSVDPPDLSTPDETAGSER